MVYSLYAKSPAWSKFLIFKMIRCKNRYCLDVELIKEQCPIHFDNKDKTGVIATKKQPESLLISTA